MNLPTWYNSGLVTVLSSGTTVTGTGSLWGTGGVDDNIMIGDLFSVPSQPLVPAVVISGVTDDGELELMWPWPGADVAAQPYIIRYVGITERSTRANRMALERMGEISAWYDVIVETDADRLALETVGSPLRAGYRVLVKDDGVIWAKETSTYGDWIGPVEFKGDKGEKGWGPQLVAEEDGERRVLKLSGYTGGEGTAPTANVGQYLKPDGTWTAVIGEAADFRGESLVSKGDYNAGTAYAKGDYVQQFGSSWVLTAAASTGNAPPTLPATSNAYWQLLARQGIDGAGTGDVVGPAVATADRIALFNGTTGKLLKDAGKTLADILSGQFQDPAAPTKKAHFGLSGITAGQDREIVLPDRNIDLSKMSFDRLTSLDLSAGVAAADFTGLAAADYDTIMFDFKKVRPQTAASSLNAYVSTVNGAPYVTSGYNHGRVQFTFQTTPGIGYLGGTGTGFIEMANSVSNSTDDGGVNGRVFFHKNSDGFGYVDWSVVWRTSSVGVRADGGAGFGAGVNAIRFAYSAGVMAGVIRAYGLRNKA